MRLDKHVALQPSIQQSAAFRAADLKKQSLRYILSLLEELELWREGMVEVGRLDVSATRIRGALRDGDESAIAEWIAPGVAGYIRERGLYRGV